MSKPKVGFYWCASCGGCEEAIVDLAEALLEVVELVDVVFWPCAMDFKRSDVEAMADGGMAVCFVNGAIRSSEQMEMAKLCRLKSQLLIAFGSCSHLGGIPGLANLDSRDAVLQDAYGHGVFSTVNPDDTRPQPATTCPEGELELPTLDERVKSLDQVVNVDYYLPGCPPPVKLIEAALTAIVQGELPPPHSVLAPDIAMCHDCPRIESKPEEPFIREFKRPHEILIDPEKCFLAQGLICVGPATRSGCDHACIEGNMPCTGCLGPVSLARDHGGSVLSALASLVASDDADEVNAILDGVPDPVGTFYRYGLPASMLFARAQTKHQGEEQT
jgi:F420-non-reducing hydrogenase small subunit